MDKLTEDEVAEHGVVIREGEVGALFGMDTSVRCGKIRTGVVTSVGNPVTWLETVPNHCHGVTNMEAVRLHSRHGRIRAMMFRLVRFKWQDGRVPLCERSKWKTIGTLVV